ncbi:MULTISPECIES: DUF2889 domain-containing protein [unclassified Azospirillum]|uniref:DUF2889 domain-containing protein n=1 Tax=unclassified Azospirillum TaxID=2630922 RepID=UPI000B76945C|nr:MULTISPECIES: DUF2889 domain-containing protein [unclassified Azospirillum]SNS58113.1 Protein of unknown function [Azospirillum sp. RU38E]SNS77940.1 Protein of unknown function [Azospirillum sp. RU37A]
MPLPPPADRTLLHTRKITCQGYRRADGLWDVEGHLTDARTYAHRSLAGEEKQPDDFIHDLWIRLTLDDSLTVRAVEVAADTTPFTLCPAIAPAYQKLIGLSIASGWTAAVKERLGGVQGCTHLVELLGPVATTAFQTIAPLRQQAEQQQREAMLAQGQEPPPRRPPPLLDGCHSFASDGPLVQRLWPEFAKPPAP